MLLLYCIGEGGEKRQQQPPEQKNMYLYIVAVLDIYRVIGYVMYIESEEKSYIVLEMLNASKKLLITLQ